MLDILPGKPLAMEREFSSNPISLPEEMDVAPREYLGEGNDLASETFQTDSGQLTGQMAQICTQRSNLFDGVFPSLPPASADNSIKTPETSHQNDDHGDERISASIARILQKIDEARQTLLDHDCTPDDVDRLIRTYDKKSKNFSAAFLHKKHFKGLKHLNEKQIHGANAHAHAQSKSQLNKISIIIDYNNISRHRDDFRKFVANKLSRLHHMSAEGVCSELLEDGFTKKYAKIYTAMRREILTDPDCLRELENICWRSYNSFPAATAGLMDAFYQLCEKLFGTDTYDYRLLFSGYYRNCSNRSPNGGTPKFALFQSLAYRARVVDENAYYWGMLRSLPNSINVAAMVYTGDNDTLFQIFAIMHALTTIVLDLCDVPGKSADGKKITICRMEGSNLIGKHGAAANVPKNKPGEEQYVKHTPLICGSLGGNSRLVGRKITIYKDIPLHRIYSGYFLEDDILGRVREFSISFFSEGLKFLHIGNLRGKNRHYGPIVRYDESFDELFHFPPATHRLDSAGNKVFTPYGALKFLKDNFMQNNFPGREFINIELDEGSVEKWQKAVKFLHTVRKNLPAMDPRSVNFRESCDVVLNFACGKFMEKPTIGRAFAHASHHYHKKFPPYEEIRVMREGKAEYFSQLAPKVQLQLLKEGIRGNGGRKTLNQIEKMLSLPDSQWDFPKLTLLMKNALHVGPGKTSRVHSALHGARAAVFVKIFANIYRRLFEEFENLSDEDIYNASIAALFHDSGREAEGIDIFEELSAQNARDYLFQSGFSDESAEKVRQIVIHKDVPVSDKDLATILLHEADCIEYLRLTHFDPRYLDVYGGTGQSNRLAFTTLNNVTDEEIRKVLIQLVEVAKEIIGSSAPDLENFSDEMAYTALYAEMIEKTKFLWEGLA
ncbi:MAG: hypothetical protein LBD72_02760 [Puniceicoccales bacterium]|jgi:hypothetical protein|nr:hypothetical protein [Puniceicoccales bacterium]